MIAPPRHHVTGTARQPHSWSKTVCSQSLRSASPALADDPFEPLPSVSVARSPCRFRIRSAQSASHCLRASARPPSIASAAASSSQPHASPARTHTMSGWGIGWFGGGSAKQKDAPKKAILQLRGQLEMLSKREKHLQHLMGEQDTIARKNANSNKSGTAPLLPQRAQTRRVRGRARRPGRPPRPLCVARSEPVLTSARSGQGGAAPQEAARAVAREDAGADHAARGGNLHDRERKHQQRDAGRDAERRQGHEAHLRRHDHRQGRPDHVRLPRARAPALVPAHHVCASPHTGRICASSTTSASRSPRR